MDTRHSSRRSPRQVEVSERILDSFEQLLLASGERATTIEHIAEHCGITRGGLIYHFSSRQEILDAFVSRLEAAGVEASSQLLAAPEGAAERYIISAGPPLSKIDRTLLAASRLANDENQKVREVLLDIHRQWVRVLTMSTGNQALARLLLLLGDGVLFHSAMTGKPFELGSGAEAGENAEREELIELVRGLIRDQGEAGSAGFGLLG